MESAGSPATKLSMVPVAVTSCEPGWIATERRTAQSASAVSVQVGSTTPSWSGSATTEVRLAGRTSARLSEPSRTSTLVIVPFLICWPVMSLAAVAVPATATRATATTGRRCGQEAGGAVHGGLVLWGEGPLRRGPGEDDPRRSGTPGA